MSQVCNLLTAHSRTLIQPKGTTPCMNVSEYDS